MLVAEESGVERILDGNVANGKSKQIHDIRGFCDWHRLSHARQARKRQGSRF
jgi:hypothetical protein